MAVAKGKAKKKPVVKAKAPARRAPVSAERKPAKPASVNNTHATSAVRTVVSPIPKYSARHAALHRMLMEKRQEIMAEIGASLGQSLTDDQQRRLESAMDVGDQALMDLERELGISLMEMRNKKRQMIDEALTRLTDGTYGVCAECGVEISEKRLAAVPFARLCVQCQSKEELIEKIEKEEDRD